jgi:hypothetical protein
MKHGYQRFNQYPKGSILWLHIRCYHEVVSEQRLLRKFDERYQRNHEFGREYFIGDVHDMMQVILQEVGHTCNLSALVDEHSKQFESLQQKLEDQTACAIRLTKEKLLLQKELERVTNQIEDDMIKLWPPPASVNSSLNCTMNNEIDQENSSSNDEGTLRNRASKPICNACTKEFASKWSLERHKNYCKKVKSNVCPICHKAFSSRDVRNKHLKNVKCTPSLPPPPGSSSNASLNSTIKASNIHVVSTCNDFLNLRKDPQNNQLT